LDLKPLRFNVAGFIVTTDVHNASINTEEKRIAIYGKRSGVSYHKEFGIGDYAEYDSDDLPYYSYYGKIVEISKRGVSIRSFNGPDVDKGEVFLIDLHTFASRNSSFSLDGVLATNSLLSW
jgi:hypothetical protein